MWSLGPVALDKELTSLFHLVNAQAGHSFLLSFILDYQNSNLEFEIYRSFD